MATEERNVGDIQKETLEQLRQYIEKGWESSHTWGYEYDTWFRKVVDQNPENVDALFGFGDTLKKYGNPQNAILYFDKILAMSQNILKKIPCFPESLQLFSDNLPPAEIIERVKILKGSSLIAMGKYQEGIGILESFSVTDSQMEFDMGYTFIHLGKYEKSIECFGNFLDLGGDEKQTLDAFCYKGFAHAYLNELGAAEKMFEKALEKSRPLRVPGLEKNS